MAIALDRSGRDMRGTGGGTAAFGIAGVLAVPLTPFAVLVSGGLFMPLVGAGLGGLGGGSSAETSLACPRRCGLLGGSWGVVGGGVAVSFVTTCGNDVVELEDTLSFSTSLYPEKAFGLSISLYLFSTSSLVRLGGRGGRAGGCKVGAFTLPESNEVCRELGVLGIPFDNVEIVEMVDDIDSLENFLTSCCSEGLRGGKAGEGCVEAFLTGSLGGGNGAGFVG